jgi:hypothetical protein
MELENKLLWSLSEVIELTGWGETKAREILNRRDSTFTVRVGNKLYVNRKAFENFLDRCAKHQIAI